MGCDPALRPLSSLDRALGREAFHPATPRYAQPLRLAASGKRFLARPTQRSCKKGISHKCGLFANERKATGRVSPRGKYAKI